MARKSKVLSKSKAPKDFSKVKNKVGKKKQEKANEMKTDFKVKKVQMPAQNALEEKGEEVTHRKLGLGELLAHLQHHSAKVRRDALKGLLELCRDHPGVLNVNLSQILDSISLAASDGSADVRSAQRSLQAFILDQMPPAALSAFGATLALQVRGAISHVSGEVREDGLKLLDLYLSRLGSKQVLTQGEAGRLVSTLCQLHSHVELVLPCLLQLLSTQTVAADEDGEVSQLSLQDVLEGKLKKVTSVSRDSEADNEIWDFCLRAWMQAGDMPRGDAKGSGAKAGWMRLRVAAVLEQALIEVLAGSGDSRPSASQVATLSGIVRRQEWPIHVDAGSPLRPLADSINLRMARMLALLVTGASQDAAPKHLQRLAHASLAVLDTVLLPAVAAVATHVRTLSVAAAAAAAAQALEVVAKGSDEATEVKPFTSIGCLCHGLLVLELLWSQTEHFSTTDLQHLAGVTAAVAAGTGRRDDEFLPTTAAILAVPLTASLLDLHSDPVPPLLQRAVPRRCARQTSRDTARVIEELRPGTLMSWVTSWPKLLWYLGSSHPKLSLFLMTTILKLGKAAEAGSLHEKLLSGLLPLLVPFIAGMPGDQSAPPLAKLTEEDGLQAMAAAMLFHFPRLRVSLIKLLGNALCRWSVATNGDAGLGDTCCELILEAMLHGQSSESDEEVLIARLRASLAVLQSCPATDDAERSSLKLANVIAAWVVEQLGATYPTKNRLIGLRLDQRRHLALQHVAWPLCRDLLGAKMSSSVMARRAFCFFYLCARRLTGTGTGTHAVDDDADISGRVAFLREVFDSLVLSDALQAAPVFQSLLREKSSEARGASLFVQAWMAAATPHRSAAYELLLRLCAERLDVDSAAWVLVEAVMYRNAHGLNTDSWGLSPLGFDGPAPSPSALRQQLRTSTSTSSAAREQILALLPLL